MKQLKFWNDPAIIGKTPLVTVFLLDSANIGQIYRMWHEHSALGQNLFSWMLVGVALLLFCNFYRVCIPDNKFALYSTLFGATCNLCVCLSVIRFRYFA